MRVWFKTIGWDRVVQTNKASCEKTGYQYGLSPSQSPKMQRLWEINAERPMSLLEMVDLCRRIHIGAPFLNFNGNTFAALAVEASLQINHPDQFLPEDAICNAITETLGPKGARLLQETSEKLEQAAPRQNNQRRQAQDREI